MAKSEECIFCNVGDERKIACNSLAFAIRDSFPVTPGHTLIIPFRHVEDYLGMTPEERRSSDELLQSLTGSMRREDQTIEVFNIGMNCGATAGQTIFHCHIHLIPRRRGDVENPRGGIRHLIPGKGYY